MNEPAFIIMSSFIVMDAFLREKMEKLKEECGVFGIIGDEPINAVGYTATALLSLQHRGQESAGIVTFLGDGEDAMVVKKDAGMVNDIFGQDFIDSCAFSSVAVGHVRYSTTGSSRAENAQPIAVSHSRATFAMAHNGNITNAAELREKIVNKGGIFYTTNDSEIICVLIIEELLKTDDLETAVFNVMDIIEGAFSIVVATADKMIAARDKNGFRPLCIGKLGNATVFSSESCALDGIGASMVRDVKRGELISVDKKGNMRVMQKDVSCAKEGLCVFEMVYFARPDSFIDGMSVHEARLEMGRALAKQAPVEADLVCGVPDSGLTAAYGYSQESGIPYGSAFIKNRYVGRSFIAPTQVKREKTVSVKLNPLKAAINGKRIVLVDDSIVRGTTSAKIIRLLREAGAKEVHMRISCPPFKYQCYFGTDVDSRENLIANHYSIEEIARRIGADSLAYLSEENLYAITLGTGVKYCGGCFSGNYPIAVKDSRKDKFD